jgi:hypothetical protein
MNFDDMVLSHDGITLRDPDVPMHSYEHISLVHFSNPQKKDFTALMALTADNINTCLRQHIVCD